MTAGPALEMWSNQSVTESSDGTTYTMTARRAFTVTLDATDPPETAKLGSGVPAIGDLYPGTVFVFCENREVSRPSPIMAIVVCTYKGEISQSGSPSSDPVNNDPVLTWRSVTTDEPIDQDYDGNAIVTVNGEPIDGLTERFTDDLLIVERNYRTINRYALRAYRRATNSDIFAGWPAGTARIMEDEATAVWKNGRVQYWRVRAAIQFRKAIHTTDDKAWYKRVRHEGYLVRDAVGEDPYRAFDLKTKQPVTRKILLTEDGLREDDPDNAYWLEFKTLGKLPYSALGLI